MAWRIPQRSYARKAATTPRLVFFSKVACQQFLAAYSGEGFRYSSHSVGCPQILPMSSSVRPEPVMSDRWVSFWPHFLGAANTLITNHLKYTPGIEAALVVDRKTPEYVLWKKLSGCTMPIFRIVMEHGAHVFKINEKAGTPWSLQCKALSRLLVTAQAPCGNVVI